MKKHLLLNQLFGTVGSPNQTGETLTRENRIGLMSYLHRTLMLFFAVLTLSIANIGQAWGTDSRTTITWDFTTDAFCDSWSTSSNAVNTIKNTTSNAAYNMSFTVSGSNDKFDSDHLKTNGATKVNSSGAKKNLSQRYFTLPALSGKAKISVQYSTTANVLRLINDIDTVGHCVAQWGNTTASSTVKSSVVTFSGSTTYYLILPVDKVYFSKIQWIPCETVTFDASTNGGSCATATMDVEKGGTISTLPIATKDDHTFDGWFTAPTGGTQLTTSTEIDDNVTYYAHFSSVSPAPAARTFKSGEKIYLRDAENNFDFDALWKVSGNSGNVYAFFWNTSMGDSYDEWSSSGGLADGEWNDKGAVYEITVPGDGKEFTHVHFTRGNEANHRWNKSIDCTPPDEWLNMFNMDNETSHKVGEAYNGSWAKFTPSGKTVYFDNRNVEGWGTTAYVRIGHGSNNAAWGPMTPVDGTRNLYSKTTSSYANHTEFSVANGYGWTNNNSIVQPWNNQGLTGGQVISKQTNYQQYAIQKDIYICPTATSVSENGCQYYTVDGASTSSHTDANKIAATLPSYTVTTTSATNCTVTLQKCTNYGSGTYTDLSSGGTVMPTQYIKVTITPTTGYKYDAITITGATQVTAPTVGSPTGVYYVTGDCEVSATCVAKTCTIVFDKEGGSGTISNVTATYGSAMPSKAENLPTKDGYTFDGFWDGDNGTGTQYYKADGTSKRNWDKDTESNTTLYAKWNCVTPTFGTNLSTTQVDYDKDASASALTVAATAGGGTVTYQWYSNDENNTTTPTTLTNCTTATYTPLTSSVGTTYYYCVATNSTAGCSTTTTSNIAKIVVSEAATYSVTYNANNGSATGSVPTDDKSYTASDSVVVKEPGNLAVANKTFVGWNTKSDGSGTYASPGARIKMSGDLNLHAVWQSASSCPGSSGGTVFALTMKTNTNTTKNIGIGESVLLGTTYATTLTGGNVSFTDVGTRSSGRGDTKAKLEKGGGSGKKDKITFAGNDAMLTIYLDCALAEGDIISYTGGDVQLSFTPTPVYGNSIYTTSKSCTIPEASVLIGKKIIYCWRKTATSFSVTDITITRPASCTDVSITTEPTTPVAATVGSACSITGLVAAGTNPMYQWQTCNSDGTGGVDITAAGAMSFTNWTTATLGLTPTAAGSTYYQCVVSGDCGDPVTSNVVTVNASAAPAGDCHKYFYYGVLSAPSPAPTKNEDSFFSSVPSSGSSASESWEIDDVTYTTSSRCSNSNNIGTFTIPSGKVATMYVMFNGSSSYTMTIKKGGSDYKTGIDASSGIKKYTEEDMGPGTYAVTTTGNVGLYLLIVDVCDATPCTIEPTVSVTTKGATTSTTQVVNCSGISSLGTGTCTITSYGFVYGTSANPTLSNSYVEVGTSYTVTGTAFAETTLTGLTPSTTYYVRAYATNGAGTGYGDAVSFTTSAAPAGAPVITDQPDLSEVALGETASFSLTATGATSYQWYSCDSEGENKTEASGASAATASYSYTTTVTGTTYYICKVSNASGDTWSEVVGSIVNPVSFTIHYEAGSTDDTAYTTETFTQTKEVNDEAEDYISTLTKFAFNGVEISDKGKKGTMSMQISMPTSEDAGKYVSFTFTVAPNYYLSVDNIDIRCQPVGNANHNYKVVLTDALGTTITGTSSTNTKGELNSINFPAAQLSGKRLVGLVTVKIFGWYSSSDTYRLAKNTYITGTVSSLPAPTASWTARPASATVGDGGKTYTLTTDATNTVAWSITDQSGATSAALSSVSGLTTTLGSYTTAGSLYVQASVTGDGIHYLSTPATLLRQRVVISAGCEETTLISATLSSCTGTGDVTGTPGGTSAVAFESCESLDGGYKMGKNGSYMRLALTSGNFAANDEVKITITKASDQGDGALHIYKYASETWMELGSVTAAGAGTYSYTLTESNVSTSFNTIGLYRTGSNQNPYVKALSVVRSSCSASKPSGVTVTASAAGPYAIGATPTLTVTATNADTYQWYSNTNNTASDGFLLVGETATTYSPSTAIAGTTYYYCVATNASGSTVSNIITVTVNSAKTAPTVSWTDTYTTPTYGGGGYAVKATVSTGAWDGTLTTDMLTASDGVTLTGVSVSGKVITATYGVTEAARSPIAFTLTLPETTNYTALEANSSNITFTSCEGGETTTATKIPVLSAYTTSSNPTYRWETADVGWFTWETGASTLSSESGSYSGFSYRTKSGKSSVLFYSELDAVRKVRLYIRGAGTTTLSKVQTGTAYNKYKTLTASTDYNVAYSNESSSIESKEDGYIEIGFKSYLSAGTFVAITLSRNTYYYGVELITGTEEVGTITTALSWATDPGTTVNKYTTDANFRYEAVKASDAASQATLGTISYKSSKPAVATVSATGVVDVLGVGNTTITATLASSGCYKKATLSYNLVVAEATCTDEAGTITASGEGITIDGNTVTKTDACANVTLTVNGHTGDGGSATYQWYQDGVSMGSSYQTKSITVTENGDYTVEVTNTGGEHCTMPATNTITITGEAISITKIVDEWYVKNGRRTPDIALATIEGTTEWSVKEGETDITSTGLGGCKFYMQDGVVYLKGQKNNGDEPSDLTAGDATLTITAVSACGDDPTATITIHKQVSTAKPSVAFVVDGTSGNPVNEVATTKTSSRPIWVYLSTYFDLTGCNAYWTNNEKLIRQYYSQFDAIVITDDPNTGTGPTSGKKYVNALGTMVDVRPILTMEAYVGKYGASSNWHIGATPSSPNPRQYEMKLQCKDHDIFAGLTAGANFRSEEIDGETYYYVTMVDNSVTPYAGLADDAETETYPALQGFSAAAIKGTGLLGIGTISDGTLQGGVERQNEPTARMMILGIQHQAMAALTAEGKQVIMNAIEYLLKTNMEDVDDCSNFFIGGTDGHAEEWHTASNWSSGKLPDASTKTRILAPVTISTKVHVAQVDIAIDGTSKHIAGTCNGRVTIAPTGALIVDGQVRRTTNGRLFTEDELEPTTPADLVINTNETKQGALIFDNDEGTTQATVQVYSKSYKDGSDNRHWQYLTSPLQETPVTEFFYGIGTYTFKYEEARGGWVQYNLGTTFDAFDAIGLTQAATKDFYFYGQLASTEDRELNLTYGSAGGENMFGNSWTAPIQLTAFTDADFTGGVEKTFYVYNTGFDLVPDDNHADASATAGQWQSIPLSSLTKLTGDGAWTGLKVIPAYQAYYVKCSSAGTITLNYDKHVRPATYDTNEPLRAPRRMTGADSEVLGMRISVQNDAARSDIYLLESDQFTEGFDNGWDGNYFSGDANVSQFYSVSPMGKMAVSALPDLDGTILGFEPAKKNEEYTFTFHCNDGEYYLNDLKLEQSTLIQTDESYTFTMEEGDSANRFYISATPFDKPGIATGVTDLDADAPKVQKIIYNDKLYIIRGGKVYSAEGQLVK